MRTRNTSAYGQYLNQPVRTGTHPQQQALPEQVRNAAGGFVFKVTDEQRLLRFLILGSDSPTYYASARDMTKDNAKLVEKMLNESEEIAMNAVKLAVTVSQENRAAKNDPAIFTLALASVSKFDKVRSFASSQVLKVCRQPTFLFQYVEFAQALRGWGSALQRPIKEYYENTPLDKLAMHALKYRQRNGWTHRDLLRLAHPKTDDPSRNALFEYIVKQDKWETPPYTLSRVPAQVCAFEAIKGMRSVYEVAKAIRDHRLTHEMVPNEFLGNPVVWEALLEDMPLGATLRTLNRMTANGLLVQGSDALRTVVNRLQDAEVLKKARIHPFNVLVAQRTYSFGHGYRGSMSWSPVPAVNAALEDAFYASFGFVEPANKRTYLALDISPSMYGGSVMNSPLTPGDAAGAMAMVTLRSEGDLNARAYGFCTHMDNLGLTSKDSLNTVVNTMRRKSMGGTNASIPLLHAIQQYNETKGREVYDAFVMYTDNESWSSSWGYNRVDCQPFEALDRYRQLTGLPVKMICVGFTATHSSIGRGDDPLTLELVGFDSSAPKLISEFLKDSKIQ